MLLLVTMVTAGSSWGQTGVVASMDGELTTAEISEMDLVAEGDTYRLYAASDQEYLRIGIESDSLYVASLCLQTGADHVSILHASAALGSLGFAENGDSYLKEGEFNWAMRETSMDPEAIKAREKYLADFAWVANTMEMGPAGQTEFLISRKMVEGDKVFLAVGLMTTADPSVILALPAEANGCATHSLVSGSPEDSYSFRPEQWMRIRLSSGE